jgi:hypothetical protein
MYQDWERGLIALGHLPQSIKAQPQKIPPSHNIDVEGHTHMGFAFRKLGKMYIKTVAQKLPERGKLLDRHACGQERAVVCRL